MVSTTAKEMLRAHIAGELAGDIDATMAPLSDYPIWVTPTHRIEGRDAVRALYERVLKVSIAGLMDEYLRALDDPQVTKWGESHCVIEYSDEYPLHRGWVSVVHFDGDRVAGEHAYVTLPDQMKRYGEGSGEDFEALPGVTRRT
jgi:hypothetical protein